MSERRFLRGLFRGVLVLRCGRTFYDAQIANPRRAGLY